ncbi:MAG: hypothetical protein ABL921_08620, partial [Pirellula sp.]
PASIGSVLRKHREWQESMIIRLSMIAAIEGVQDVVLSNASWLNMAIVAGVLLAILTLFSYRRSAMPIGLKPIGILLRCLGIATLLLILLEPLGTLDRPKPQANVFAILVDSSQSIDVLRTDRTPTEVTKVEECMRDDADWQRKLSDDFRVRRYIFDTVVEPVDTYEGLEYRGNESALYRALGSISDRFQGRPMAGVLLFSDGQATDTPSVAEPFKNLGFPVYPVGAGKLSHSKDLRIASVTTRQSDFETAPVTITASIAHRGFGTKRVKVDLIDSDQKMVQSQTTVLKQDDELVNVEFRFRPEKSGVQGYQIVAMLEEETAAPKKDDSEITEQTGDEPIDSHKELTLGNNRRFQVVDRGRGPYRILYVAGRPNWEYKFLKRALDEDDEIQLTSLIRIAKKEPKFSFRDSRVESANPLFSGFEDVLEEEKEKYDEPVFARMGRTSQDQLKKGFPKDADELFEYSAIVLDDLEHDFFSAEQQSLLRQFVAVRGGGLLVLGGQESMRGKGFKNSVLNQILPVYGEDGGVTEPTAPTPFGSVSAMAEATETPKVEFTLTREGWLQPFLRLAENETAEKVRLERMPPFEVLNRTKGVKPGASVLAEAKLSNHETVPLLATQRFGKGRTAALMVGDMWRWGLHHDGPKDSPLGQSWRQMIRWLMSDVPKPIQMKLKSDASENNKASVILVEVNGTDFKPVDNAQVSISITTPSGKESVALAEGSATTAGQYESTVVADEMGVYTATSEVRALDGSLIGTSQLGWVYEPSAKEFHEIGTNDRMLESLASETGGEVVDIDDLDSFVASLPSKKVPVTEKRVFPLWHQSWVLLFALACLCIEWGMRRRYGMA